MAATVSKAGPYYASGSISFSSLRTNFKESSSGSISASELRRNTTVTNKNPIVPDCTENRSSGPLETGISTLNNLRLSQFRNSIKYYYITQTDTNINFDIDAQSWNSNLNKNIRKWMFVNGTTGSNSTSSAASSLNATAYNLTIDVSGGIYGAGGAGGDSTTPSGGDGGDALSINSPDGNNIVVFVRATANIYGGGGGGEKGSTGDSGTSGTCYSVSYETQRYTTGNRCRSCPDCDSGWYRVDCFQREGRCDWRGQYRKSVCERVVTISTPYSVPGAPGGAGGDGAAGRGYNNLETLLSGVEGSEGTTGGCPSYGGSGKKGETGGNGGDWGADGGTGSGGTAGRAVVGNNYSITGTISSITVKGFYKPS